MIQATILIFERLGQEEYRTVAYSKSFTKHSKIGDVLDWVKSIDPTKDIKDVYFNNQEGEK